MIVTAGVRGSNMKERMQGIKGDAVTELLRQKMSEKLEPHFEIAENGKNLATEVQIAQWGWFVPTTALGIKTGSYQFMLNGTVNVYDTAKNREHVGYVVAGSQQPLGNDPTPQQSQEALLKATEDFSNKAMAVILQNKPATKAP
jgi:hypothetical protein